MHRFSDIGASDSAARTPPLKRLACYLYLADLIEGRRVLEVGCGEGRGAEFLARRGARRVTGIDSNASAIESARRRLRLADLEFRCERLDRIELEDDSFDCIFVPEGARVLRWQAALTELRRLLKSSGQLVLMAASADRPGALGGASYHEILDRLEPVFSPVRMLAQAPFAAMSLVAYAEGTTREPDVELDTSLRELSGPADDAAEVSDYIAVCGEPDERARPLAIVQLPTEAGIAALAGSAAGRAAGAAVESRRDDALGPRRDDVDEREALARARAEADRAREARARSEAELERLRKELDWRESEAARTEQLWSEKLARERQRAVALEGEVGRLEAELEARVERRPAPPEPEQASEPAGPTVTERIADAMTLHAERVRELEAAIEERQALADELGDELSRTRAVGEQHAAAARRAEARVQELEQQLGSWRTRASVAEGELLRRGQEAVEPTATSNGSGDADGDGMAAEIEARLSLVAERLRGVERQIGSEHALLATLETGLRELYEELAGGDERGSEDTGWAANKEEQLKTFSRELGTKDAEIALMHVGLSSLRERLREVVSYVRAARAEMDGRSADEMLALMDRLSERLAVYEGMALESSSGGDRSP